MPRRSSGWLTVTNTEVFDEREVLGCEGPGRARRNPAGLRYRLAGGTSLELFDRFDIKFTWKRIEIGWAGELQLE